MAVLAGLALLTPTTPCEAQTRPDFSGRWTTEPAPASTPAATPPRGGGPARAGDMGSGWGPTITITQDSARLTVEYAFFARGDMQPPLRFHYALDGTESRNSVMMGRGIQTQVSKTVWDSDRLIITTTHTMMDPATGKPSAVMVTQTLSLEAQASLVVETTRAGVAGAPSTTVRTVYRKISSSRPTSSAARRDPARSVGRAGSARSSPRTSRQSDPSRSAPTG